MDTATTEGYRSERYARSVAGESSVIELPLSGGWLARRPIGDGQNFDATAPYPLLACQDWSQLATDLNSMGDNDVVSVTAVTDPFANATKDDLQRAFPAFLRPWKDHQIAILDHADPTSHVSSHHRRKAHRSLRKVTVESTTEPKIWAKDWIQLYCNLKSRHSISGPSAFDENSLKEQLEVPGMMAHRAVIEGVTVSMVLWLVKGKHAYYHLGASNSTGYEALASFALFWNGLQELSALGVAEVDLGAGAGRDQNEDSGLLRFKRGWATHTKPTWLGGRICDPIAYEELSSQTDGTSDWFPAYRQPSTIDLTSKSKSSPPVAAAAERTMDPNARSKAHSRNPKLELLLDELGDLLSPLNDPLVVPGARPKHPLVFVVGGPRSGSTMTMQYLAASGAFGYPTNLLSRFSYAPALGARIQLLLTDPEFDHLNELADVGSPIGFASDLGKSSGARQPHEFWYFWRRFFPIEEPRQLSPEELSKVDMEGFLAELAALEHILDAPIAMKAMLLQLNVDYLAREIENVIFVDIQRHPFFQCQSLLVGRRRYFETIDNWLGVKPPEYEWLRESDPYTQIAGQVFFGRKHLDDQLGKMPQERVVRVPYADLCASPNILRDKLEPAMAFAGSPRTFKRTPDEAVIRSSDKVRVETDDVVALVNAYYELSGEDVTP